MAALAEFVGDALRKTFDRDRFRIPARGLPQAAAVGIAFQLGKYRFQHFIRAQLAAADLHEYIIRFGKTQLLRDFLDRLVSQFPLLIGKGLFKNLSSELDVLVALGMA